MPNQTTNSSIDLSGLLRDNPEQPTVKGRWFPIRLSPDLATGEILNVGIGFIDTDNQLHTKILNSTTPFRKLYGSAGASNFSFLLALLREHFARIETAEQMMVLSPHIHYGEQYYASGDSVNDVLDQMYDTMVTIGRLSEEDESADKKASYGTDKLTQKVLRTIREQYSSIYDHIHQPKPIVFNEHNLVLDVPLFVRNGHFNQEHASFGVLCSVAYKAPNSRESELAKSFMTAIQASTVLDAQNISNEPCVGIYRPNKKDQPWLTDADITLIDNSLDAYIWSIKKQKAVHVEVEDDTLKLTQRLVEKVAA